MVCLDYVRPSTRDTLLPYVNRNRLSNRILDELIVPNGIVLPGSADKLAYGGVVTQDEEWVEEASWHKIIGGPYEYDPSQLISCDETVIYAGYLHWQWGHNIMDNFRKLWFLLTKKGQNLIAKGTRVVYVTIRNKELPDYVVRTFQCAGVDVSNMERITHPTRFKEIIIPDNSVEPSDIGRVYTQEYVDIIARIKESVTLQFQNKKLELYDKIYFTRTQLPDYRRDYGEKSIERLFRRMGYKVLAPEKLDTLEQIYLLMNCKSFAATEGSVSHNAIFCRPETEVIVLKKADYLNYYQFMVNEMSGANVVYIDVHHSPIVENPWLGPFYLCVTPELKHFFNLSRITFPYLLKYGYWKFLFHTKLKPFITPYIRKSNLLYKFCKILFNLFR